MSNIAQTTAQRNSTACRDQLETELPNFAHLSQFDREITEKIIFIHMCQMAKDVLDQTSKLLKQQHDRG